MLVLVYAFEPPTFVDFRAETGRRFPAFFLRDEQAVRPFCTFMQSAAQKVEGISPRPRGGPAAAGKRVGKRAEKPGKPLLKCPEQGRRKTPVSRICMGVFREVRARALSPFFVLYLGVEKTRK